MDRDQIVLAETTLVRSTNTNNLPPIDENDEKRPDTQATPLPQPPALPAGQVAPVAVVEKESCCAPILASFKKASAKMGPCLQGCSDEQQKAITTLNKALVYNLKATLKKAGLLNSPSSKELIHKIKVAHTAIMEHIDNLEQSNPVLACLIGSTGIATSLGLNLAFSSVMNESKVIEAIQIIDSFINTPSNFIDTKLKDFMKISDQSFNSQSELDLRQAIRNTQPA